MRCGARETMLSAVRILSLLLALAAVVVCALAFEYSDDTIGSSAEAWLLHGGVAFVVFAVGHLLKKSKPTLIILGVLALGWSLIWTSFAVRFSMRHLPMGWAVQEVVAPSLPILVLVLDQLPWRLRPSPGLCPNCGYDLRASPKRFPNAEQ
jgi:hypothetical protein